MTPAMTLQSLSDMTDTASTDGTAGRPAAPTELRLRFMGSGRQGQMLKVPGEKFSLGSESGCTIRLRSPLVADLHVWGIRGPLGTLLRAVSPDTRINGLPFHETWLQHGDLLSIGPIDFQIELESQPAVNPAPLPQLPVAPATASSSSMRALRQHEHQRMRRLLDQLRNQRSSSQSDIQRPTLTPSGVTAGELPEAATDAASLAIDLQHRREQVESKLAAVDRDEPQYPQEEQRSAPPKLSDHPRWDPMPTESATFEPHSQYISNTDSVGTDLESLLQRLQSSNPVSDLPQSVASLDATQSHLHAEPSDYTSPLESLRETPPSHTTSDINVDLSSLIAPVNESHDAPDNEDPLSRIRASLASLLEDRPNLSFTGDSHDDSLPLDSPRFESYTETSSYLPPQDEVELPLDDVAVPSPYEIPPVDTTHSQSTPTPVAMSGRQSERSESADEDFSIDSYMQQLFARLGGNHLVEEPTPSPSTTERSTQERLSATTKAVTAHTENPPRETITPKPEPRPIPNLVHTAPRVAPERRDDLASLRQVANETATWALDASRRKRRITSTIGWSSAALLSLTTGGLLVSATKTLGTIAYPLGLVALGFAAFALLKTVKSNLHKS